MSMSRKLLFDLPRPSVPVFVRRSPRSGGAPVESMNSQSPLTSWTRSDLEYPVRRVYCVGRNYREHALEMGGDPNREPPFFFQKPTDAVVVCGPSALSTTSVPYPPATSSLHHEGELIVAVGEDGVRIPVEHAAGHVYGYAVGCDLTRRDLQADAKRTGRPWDASKGFDASCPMSPIVPKEDFDPGSDATIRLAVNGSERQRSALRMMIYSVPEIISNLSRLFSLHRGDLIMTGTPAGVSALKVGDRVCITCGDLMPCEFMIGQPE